MDSFEEVEMEVEELEAELEAEIESMLEPEPEPVEEIPNVQEEIEETTEEEINEPVVMLAESEPEPEKTKEQKKNDALNKIVAIKLAKISEQRAVATTLEEAANLEALIIALLNFNAGYKSYGGYLPDAIGYESRDIYIDKYIPDNTRGLRNGLAQELLHKQMVDLQWQR
jgi:hypothetical protein